MPFLHILFHIIFIVTYVISFSTAIDFANANHHLINSVYVFTDVWITGVPFRILHFWHTEIYGIAYLIFSLIHWGAGGDPIYPVLDYSNDPTTAAICIVGLAFVGVPLFHMIMFGCFWLRVLIYGACCVGVAGGEAGVMGSAKISADSMEEGVDGISGHENEAYRLEEGHM